MHAPGERSAREMLRGCVSHRYEACARYYQSSPGVIETNALIIAGEVIKKTHQENGKRTRAVSLFLHSATRLMPLPDVFAYSFRAREICFCIGGVRLPNGRMAAVSLCFLRSCKKDEGA